MQLNLQKIFACSFTFPSYYNLIIVNQIIGKIKFLLKLYLLAFSYLLLYFHLILFWSYKPSEILSSFLNLHLLKTNFTKEINLK